jgi:hypothetical protein
VARAQHEVYSLPLDDFYSAEQGKGAQTPPPFPAPYPRLFKERRTTPAENHRLHKPEFQAHLALESNSDFRLIPRWNQIPISGSFLDWKMLSRLIDLGVLGFDRNPSVKIRAPRTSPAEPPCVSMRAGPSGEKTACLRMAVL